jgi:RimJ/RimL family protein N-acetyltransferase
VRKVIETDRLTLREFDLADAAFILELVNEPAWLRFIGDRDIHDEERAREYIETGPVASYKEHGFGIYVVVLRESGVAIGVCGLIKRPTLRDVDVGFAFLREHWGNGYATESTRAMLEYGREQLGIRRIVAIAHPANAASRRVLERVGMCFDEVIELEGEWMHRFA